MTTVKYGDGIQIITNIITSSKFLNMISLADSYTDESIVFVATAAVINYSHFSIHNTIKR